MCDKCTLPQMITQGSRRRRLWDLPHKCHCPVVGVCFPLATLRQLVNKVMGLERLSSDYEIHIAAVAECTQRNRLSELLQKELETRYASTVQAFRVAKDARAVAELWAAAIRAGDVAGAFWSAMTHPRCDEFLQEVLLRDMHMLQHQAGAAERVDAARVQNLARENQVLGQELGKAQERCSRILGEKCGEIEQLKAELVLRRAALIGKDSQIAFLTQDLAQLRASLPDYTNSVRLRKRLEQLEVRQAELEALNSHLNKRLTEALRGGCSRLVEPATVGAAVPTQEAASVATNAAADLHEKTILCVGGRSGSLPYYREAVEKLGGLFSHHDGGLENNQGELDSVLAAADLVICQTGCISHNAYWRVKDFCKRTGKRCVFVENPSTSSLARTLQQIAGADVGVEVADDLIAKAIHL